MKPAITIFFLLFLFSFAQAQTRILFDATKAEMASNADWVIDADQYNVYGNEANPQRFPTPSQSGINANTNESYWKGALSAWAVDCVKEGYIVETLPISGDITYGSNSNLQDLTNYEIFVVCEPNIKFTWSEKTALMKFVQNGGGLFMISDHDNSDRNGDGWDSPAIWNDFMENNSVKNNPFGIEFDYEFFTEVTTNIPNLPDDPLLHGNYGNVTQVEFYGGTSLTLHPNQNASVKGAVYRTGVNNTGNYEAICAYATYGEGKVVALGDSSPSDDGSGDPQDNLYDGWIEDANGNHERLIMNATIWLAQKDVVSTEEQLTPKTISVYPNPVATTLNMELDIDVESVWVYDYLGHLVYSASAKSIDVGRLSKGLYFLRVYGHGEMAYATFEVE